jgi:AcrR family transcriptional regulator
MMDGKVMESEAVKAQRQTSGRMTGAQRKKRIIEATIEMVGRYGVQGATTARIAAASGISEKALYSHFPSKRDILVDTLDAVFERAMCILRDREITHAENALEHLRAAAKLHWPSEGEFVYPLYEFFASSPQEDLRREIKSRHQAHVQVVADIVEEGKAQGVIRPEVDSEQVGWEYFGVYWAEDIAYMIGFEDFGPSGRSTIMMERLLREIAV